MLEKQILQFCTERNLTLSLAESCTGGHLAAKLTSVPGASEYFLGSLVTYSEKLKNKLLKVPVKALKQHGAVSKETARRMCEGVLKITDSDFAIAVTGIAGPSGGTPDSPVGTIWYAFGHKGNAIVVQKMQLKGNRKQIIEECTHKVLEEFLIYLIT